MKTYKQLNFPFDPELIVEDIEPKMDEPVRKKLENRLKRLLKDMKKAGINNIFVNDGILQCFIEENIHTDIHGNAGGEVNPELAIIRISPSEKYPNMDGGATL